MSASWLSTCQLQNCFLCLLLQESSIVDRLPWQQALTTQSVGFWRAFWVRRCEGVVTGVHLHLYFQRPSITPSLRRVYAWPASLSTIYCQIHSLRNPSSLTIELFNISRPPPRFPLPKWIKNAVCWRELWRDGARQISLTGSRKKNAKLISMPGNWNWNSVKFRLTVNKTARVASGLKVSGLGVVGLSGNPGGFEFCFNKMQFIWRHCRRHWAPFCCHNFPWSGITSAARQWTSFFHPEALFFLC